MSELELEKLRADNGRMRDLLDRRPAVNQGLIPAYLNWTRLVYASDLAFAQSHVPPYIPSAANDPKGGL